MYLRDCCGNLPREITALKRGGLRRFSGETPPQASVCALRQQHDRKFNTGWQHRTTISADRNAERASSGECRQQAASLLKLFALHAKNLAESDIDEKTNHLVGISDSLASVLGAYLETRRITSHGDIG